MPNTVVKVLHVVAGVIRGNNNKIFIAKRPEHTFQGGKWEFPGGKVDAGESHEQALRRELQEEVGITVQAAQPLIQIKHQYNERLVCLDVWDVTAFSGQPYGKEGQETQWIAPEKLHTLQFLAANFPIITAIQLPTICLVTPEPTANTALFLNKINAALNAGIRLIQLRAKTLSASEYIALATRCVELTRANGAHLMLNDSPCWVEGAAGVHLTSSQLRGEASIIEYPEGVWVSAACHSPDELRMAATKHVDFAYLSPVNVTASHPDAITLGWDLFGTYVKDTNIPVYALGGMGYSDVERAKQKGAQGVAAIRQIWDAL